MKKIPFAVVKMVNIVLLMIPFLICWTLYYEPRTTTVGSKQVSVLVMIIFFLICYYFGQRLDCFRAYPSYRFEMLYLVKYWQP